MNRLVLRVKLLQFLFNGSLDVQVGDAVNERGQWRVLVLISVARLPVTLASHANQLHSTDWTKKVSCCIAGCNCVNYVPILRNSTVRKLTKFWQRCTLCAKKDQNVSFRNISYKTRTLLMKFGTPFHECICYKTIKCFPPHVNNVSTLIAHVLQSSYYIKKVQNLSHLNCGLQIRQIWTQLITACRKCCKRQCTKHASLASAVTT